MYKSPIDILYGQMETQLEGAILKAVQKVGVDVDKEELIRALKFDRDQYSKGYDDATKSIVHCEECKYRKGKSCFHPFAGMWVGCELKDSDFCSYGERRE